MSTTLPIDHAAFPGLVARNGQLECRFSVALDGEAVMVDLNGDTGVTRSELDAAAAFVRERERLDEVARAALVGDLDDGEASRPYVEHHLAEIPTEVLQRSLGVYVAELTPAQFLAHMQLVRIGLYPGSDKAAELDYSIDPELTDHLLVVSLDATGTVTAVDMES